MKFKFKKKYVQIGIISFCVIAASLFVYYLLFNHTAFSESFSNVINIISPVIYGFIFAFLMTPILNFVEKKVIKVLFTKWKIDIVEKQKLIRAISIIITVAFVLAIFYGFFYMVIPRVKDSIVSIVNQFDNYIKNFEQWLDTFFSDNPKVSKNFDELLEDIEL